MLAPQKPNSEKIKKMNKSIAEKTKPIWKCLPFGSLVNCVDKQYMKKDSITKFVLKSLGHSAYAVVSAALLTVYVGHVRQTGSLSIPEQNRIFAGRKVDNQRYAELEQSIFGKNGYADVNQDGNIDWQERLNVYENMGLDSLVLLPARKPTTLELKNAVYLFEVERK